MKILVRKPTEGEKAYMVHDPIWESDPCEFDYHYDHNETVLVEYGRATVRYPGGEATFGAGDLVFFPKGLDTHWIVIEKMKKYEH